MLYALIDIVIKFSKSKSYCKNVNQIVKMSIKLSKYQSNCQHVNEGYMTTRLYYDQSVWIKLAHRLYSDFQYFLDGANFCAILGHFWPILAILGQFWTNLGNFGSFLGYFG